MGYALELTYENDELLNATSSSNCCFPSEKSIYEAIDDLDRDNKPFAFFDLNLSDEDRHLLSGLKIKDSKQDLRIDSSQNS